MSMETSFVQCLLIFEIFVPILVRLKSLVFILGTWAMFAKDDSLC